MIRHVATIALTGILLAGCTTLSTYTRPAIPNAPNWGDAAGVRNPLSMANWWRSFGDSNLDRLVARVLESNNDMLAASVRVRIALLQAERSGLALMPTLTGSGNAERATP